MASYLIRYPSVLILSLILATYNSLVSGQNITENISKAFDRLSEDIPADQVFLHPDRNLYHAGDTIRFKAYIRDRKTGLICSESISLYSLLLDQEHQTIDSARFRIINSTASGWLGIPENISSGTYTIVAFTSMMMNYSSDFIFIAPVRIEENHPAFDGFNAGKFNHNVNSSPNNPNKSSVDLRFLPEGGTFIYGIHQRLAFNAVSSDGKVINVSGEIANQKGDVISRFRSGQYGAGLVEFTPVSGDIYYASLQGQEFTGMKWPLPKPDSSGVAMKVVSTGSQGINIFLEGKGVGRKQFLMAVTMNNSLILAQEVRLDSLRKFAIRTENLPAGTVYITVYDNELNPLAERLAFINDQRVLKFDISHTSDSLLHENETELVISPFEGQKEKVSSLLSVSVIDSLSGYYSSLPIPDIESTFLFDREFYNNLPAFIRIKGLSNIDKESLNLLLLTYGWRRFSFHNYIKPRVEKKIISYDFLKISNLEKFSKSQKLMLLTLENSGTISVPVNRKKREAVLDLKELSDSVRQVMILADNINTPSMAKATIAFPTNKSFSDSIRNLSFGTIPKEVSIQVTSNHKKSESEIPDEVMDKIDFPFENVVNIEEVTIKAKHNIKQPEVFVNDYERTYRSSLVKTLTRKDIISWPSLEFALASLNPVSQDFVKKTISFRPSVLISADSGALFVLNDIPVGNNYTAVEYIPVTDIESITAVKGSMGFTRYGDAAKQGIVFITTKTKFENEHRIWNENLMTPVRLYRSEIEFYEPSLNKAAEEREKHLHPTVLWEDELISNGEDPIKLVIPALAGRTLIVCINGVSSTNNVGSKRIIVRHF